MAETTKHDPEHHGHPHGDPHQNPMVSHERRDVNIFQITAFGIGLLISCIIVVFLMWGMFAFLAHREDALNAPATAMTQQRQQTPPEPRLSGVATENGARAERSVYPRVELNDLRESESAILDNYGWVDPAKGIVRIPIDQAIDIVAQKGLPSKPSTSGENGGYRMTPSDASSGRTLEKISQ